MFISTLQQAACRPGDICGLAIRERLAALDPSNAGWQLDLMVSLWKLSRKGLAPPDQARAQLEQARAILEALNAEGKLHGEHKTWPAMVRDRLQELDLSAE